jgi:drug/metabolite transporter (DMT)-like permease
MGIKIGLHDAPPLWSAALRFVLAVLLLLILNAISGQKYPQGWRRRMRVAWPGLFTYFGSYSFTYLGASQISSALASILFAVFPFFVMLLMHFMLKAEKITLRSVMGVVMGFAGIVLIFAEPIDYAGTAFLGMGMILLSAFCAAMGTVSIKAYMKTEDVFPMVTLQMALGAILLTLTAIFADDLSLFHATAKSIGALVYLAVFGSVVSFTGYYWLLKRLPLITMSMIALITPIVAMCLGYLILDEVLTTQDYAGALLVLAGIAVVNVRRSGPAKDAPSSDQ